MYIHDITRNVFNSRLDCSQGRAFTFYVPKGSTFIIIIVVAIDWVSSYTDIFIKLLPTCLVFQTESRGESLNFSYIRMQGNWCVLNFVNFMLNFTIKNST